MKLALVGSTGLVGSKMLEIIENKHIPYETIALFSSKRSSGTQIKVNGETITVRELTEDAVNESFDYVLMSAGSTTSLKFAPLFEANGAIVIDNSSAWRMHDDIDLIVPEVNAPRLSRRIVANPNCSTIQSVLPLYPIHNVLGLSRVAYTTYQAVSGSGIAGKNDLTNGEQGIAPSNYPYPIYNNVLPHIDDFLPNGYTKEEQKMIDETKKILNDDAIKVTATCVRVPVQDSHSVHINFTTHKHTTIEEILELLNNQVGIEVIDDVKQLKYPMPINAINQDSVLVGRVRIDSTLPNTFHLWCVADNLRKGAALNAVQILEQQIGRVSYDSTI